MKGSEGLGFFYNFFLNFERLSLESVTFSQGKNLLYVRVEEAETTLNF